MDSSNGLPEFAGMDLQIEQNGVWQGAFAENTVRVGAVLDLSVLPEPIRYVKQVHWVTILDDLMWRDTTQEADGLVSDAQGVTLVVRTADCVPIHVTDGRRIAVIHAGWRGVRAGIVKRIAEWFEPREIRAVIGPSISQANYEVDQDLYGSWLKDAPDLGDYLQEHRPGSTKRLFDLGGFVKHQLSEMGAAFVQQIPVCTYASSLPSYRRDQKYGSSIYSYIRRL